MLWMLVDFHTVVMSPAEVVSVAIPAVGLATSQLYRQRSRRHRHLLVRLVMLCRDLDPTRLPGR